MFVLVLRNADYVNDCDDGYNYNHPHETKRDLFVHDYMESVTSASLAKKYKTRSGAEKFKKKLTSYHKNPEDSPYFNAEIMEIKEEE